MAGTPEYVLRRGDDPATGAAAPCEAISHAQGSGPDHLDRGGVTIGRPTEGHLRLVGGRQRFGIPIVVTQQHIEALLSPHLIIVGGGISKQSEKWVPRLTGIRARIVPAALLNDAGIVGAAMATT